MNEMEWQAAERKRKTFLWSWLASMEWNEWNAAPSRSRAARQAKKSTNNSFFMKMNCGCFRGGGPNCSSFLWVMGWGWAPRQLAHKEDERAPSSQRAIQLIYSFLHSLFSLFSTKQLHSIPQRKWGLNWSVVCLFSLVCWDELVCCLLFGGLRAARSQSKQAIHPFNFIN